MKIFNKILWLFQIMIIIYTCIFNKNGYGISLVPIFMILLATFILKIEYGILLLFCSIPFAGILKFGSTTPSVIPMIYIIIIFKFLIKNRIRINGNKFKIYILFSFIQLNCIVFFKLSINNFLIGIISIFFLLLISEVECNNPNWNINKYIWGFSISLFLSIILVIIFPKIPFIIVIEKATALAYTNRFAGMNTDPNYFNQLILIAMSFVNILFINSKHKIEKIGYVILIILFGYFGILSMSKSFAIGLIIYIIFTFIYLFRYQKNKLDNKLFVIYLFTIFCIGSVILFYVFNNITLSIFNVRESSSGNDILTGRGAIWENNINALKNNPYILFFGSGNNNEFIAGCPHNSYLELIKGYGIIGIYLIYNLFKSVFKFFKKIIFTMDFLPYLMFLVTAFSLSISSTDIHYLLMLLAIIHYSTINSNIRKASVKI